MKENKNENFEFEDVFSSSEEPQEFEDIVSDSTLQFNDTIDFAALASGNYKAKGHGAEKKGIKQWWASLTKGKKRLIISLTAVVLVIAMLLVWFFSYFRYNYNSITSDPDDLGFENVINKDVINIALFGLDTRNENSFKGNSDSIMILSLNTNTKKVKIFSVMRDSFVPIAALEGKKYGKINSAYAKGPEVAIKTLNQIFDLDISEYATVNFYGMVDIIDAVGGITATITEDELTWKGNDHPNLNNCMDEICLQLGLDASKYYIKSAGEQKLNGVQAVAYSRIRHCRSIWGTNDDYGRTDRQRHVMQGLFNSALTLPKSQYAKLIKALTPCTETSLSYTEIISMAYNMLLSGTSSFEQYRLPQTEWCMRFTGGSAYGSVVYYDLDYVAKLVHGIIYDDMTMEQFIEANPVEKNDWFMKTGAASGSGGTTTVPPVQSTPEVSEEQQPVVPEESQETPSEDITEPSSSEETGSEDTSSDDETSSEETSSEDGASVPASSDDNSSKDDTSKDESSKDESSKDESSKESSKNESVKDESSKEEDAKDDKNSSSEKTDGGSKPESSAEENTSSDTASESSSSAEASSEEEEAE